MPLQSSPLTAPPSLETVVSERLDWKYPLLTVTVAFLFIGVSAVLRLLPIRTLLADLLAVAVVLVWRYAINLANILPWHWDGSAATFSSFPQGILNVVASLVGYLTVFSWVSGGPTADKVMMAAVLSIFTVFTKFRSKAPRSHSANT
jgi:hypothetical protein